jgi:hypothetical protein
MWAGGEGGSCWEIVMGVFECESAWDSRRYM